MVWVWRQGEGIAVLRQPDIADKAADNMDLPLITDREGHSEAQLFHTEDLLQGGAILLHLPAQAGRRQGFQPWMGQGVAGDFMALILRYRLRELLPYHRVSFKFPDKVLQTGI